MSYVCPVCGYSSLPQRPTNVATDQSYEICPSCAFQFGASDENEGFSYEQWRNRWIASGMLWSSTGYGPPPDWSPRKHLSAVIAGTAKDMLEGRTSYISGAGIIFGLTFVAGLERDADLLPFQGVVSDTDALPLDPRIRAMWEPQALQLLQPIIDAKETWARELLERYCGRLVERFSEK